MYPFDHAYVLKIILFGFKLGTAAAFPLLLFLCAQAQITAKVNKNNTEAPPLPSRSKRKQKRKVNHSLTAKSGVSEFMDRAPTDTDSDYEYVANPMKKNTNSPVLRVTTDATTAKQAAQDKENNALFPKADDRSVQLGQTINIENMRAIVDSRREIMYESDGKLSNIAANTSKSSRKTTQDTD